MKEYLIDTNIFLEILLGQEKKEACKNFLNTHNGHLSISDFSLHSIGVILLNNNKATLFNIFLNDVLPKASLRTLQQMQYHEITSISKQYNLDFDDSYQSCIAKVNQLEIVTMDKDFKSVSAYVPVRWIN